MIQPNFGIKCPLIIVLFSSPAINFLDIVCFCEIMKLMMLMFMTIMMTCDNPVDNQHHNYLP